jgi:hypothetical protein
MRRKLQAVLLLMLPLLGGGCMTHRLWTESGLDDWNQPAANPDLRLFQDARRNDVLVLYNEFSERHDITRTRAFYLQPNLKPLAQHTCPHFVKVQTAANLAPIPVFCPFPSTPPGGIYAVTATNNTSFAIFSDQRQTGSYELPFYNDGVGRAERVALTPVAATVDVAIIGGVVGCTFVYMMGNGNTAEADWWWR